MRSPFGIGGGGGGTNVSALARSLIRNQQGRSVQQQLPQRHVPGHLPWGGRQFSSLQEWVAWVTAHGGNAQHELATHPGIGATFGQRGVEAGGGLAGGITSGDRVRAGGPGPPGLEGGPLPIRGQLNPPGVIPVSPGRHPVPPGTFGFQGAQRGVNLRPVSMGQQIMRRRKLTTARPIY